VIDDKPLDLTDPATLAAQCAELAPMMEQQAQAARGGSAMAGAPFPEFMFHKAAAVLRACQAKFLEALPAPVVAGGADKTQESKKK